ncbi:tail fiber assembly protein [Utexia brackfieldae]|uniref:DUF3383 family protein n=1 Tax=Utexia brackfieldae TaxID=3074108 RepID=UPI00370DCB75
MKTALIARYNKTVKEIPATLNQLKGGLVSVGANYFRGILNGSMNLSIGGVTVPLIGLNFSEVTDFDDATQAIAIIQDTIDFKDELDLDIAEDDEEKLKAWRKYRVLLNKVDNTVEEMTLPEKPIS